MIDTFVTNKNNNFSILANLLFRRTQTAKLSCHWNTNVVTDSSLGSWPKRKQGVSFLFPKSALPLLPVKRKKKVAKTLSLDVCSSITCHGYKHAIDLELLWIFTKTSPLLYAGEVGKNGVNTLSFNVCFSIIPTILI